MLAKVAQTVTADVNILMTSLPKLKRRLGLNSSPRSDTSWIGRPTPPPTVDAPVRLRFHRSGLLTYLPAPPPSGVGAGRAGRSRQAAPGTSKSREMDVKK